MWRFIFLEVRSGFMVYIKHYFHILPILHHRSENSKYTYVSSIVCLCVCVISLGKLGVRLDSFFMSITGCNIVLWAIYCLYVCSLFKLCFAVVSFSNADVDLMEQVFCVHLILNLTLQLNQIGNFKAFYLKLFYWALLKWNEIKREFRNHKSNSGLLPNDLIMISVF